MQNLNNDMEDILRRAADAYPLKNGEDRWDEISGKLHNTRSKAGKKMIWKQGFIVLLFSIAFLAVNEGRIKEHFLALGPAAQTNSFPPKNEIAGENANLNVDVEKAQLNKRTVIPALMANHIKGKISLVNNMAANLEIKSSVFQHQAGKISPNKTSMGNAGVDISNTEKLPGNQESMGESEKSNTDSKPGDYTAPIPQKPSRQQKNKGIFYGISVGMNTSEVKSGGFSKPALQAGATIGLQFNKHVAIETGLIISKRNYKSAGKYFNKKNMESSMPAGMDIMSLTGSNTFLEIPVQVSYHVPLDNRKSIYIKSGVSNYIINSENNHYKTMLNGTEGSMDASYKENKFYPAAALNVAVGLQKTISTTIGLKVEPFIQLPLKGMGIGELPIKNAGLRLVLFHQN
ncbi:MAG: outer membrane beta-barrel protein [Ferruginibacter sp.]